MEIVVLYIVAMVFMGFGQTLKGDFGMSFALVISCCSVYI